MKKLKNLASSLIIFAHANSLGSVVGSEEVLLPESSTRLGGNAEDPGGVTKIVFGSCHKNKKATSPSIWETILATEDGPGNGVDAFVWTGDAMYTSNRDPVSGKKRYGPAPPREIQKGFEEMKHNTTIGYTRLLERNIPVYGVWDDHDYGGNDMGKYMPDRMERQNVY